MQHVILNPFTFYKLYFPYFKIFFDFVQYFPRKEISLIFCLCQYILCRLRSNHFDVLFRRIGHVHFASKDGKDAVREGSIGRRIVYSPPELASFTL